jgi:type II secretory pathway pseudopilin PulG
MTYLEIAAALILLSVFAAGAGQAVFPAFEAWNRAEREYAAVRALSFVADSFRMECGRRDRDIERWKKTALAVPQLEDYAIDELRTGGVVWGLKLSASVAGERIEVLGEFAP